MLVGQKIALGRVHAHKTVTIDVTDTELAVHCDDGVRTTAAPPTSLSPGSKPTGRAKSAGSVGTVDLDDELAAVLAEHVSKYPPAVVELVDITSGTPDPGKHRSVGRYRCCSPTSRAAPSTIRSGRTCSSWCAAAGWPKEATFHSLRHFFATMLIAAGADPTEVQRALRHKLLRTTLETYVHWWPGKQRLRNVVSDALRHAAEGGPR